MLYKSPLDVTLTSKYENYTEELCTAKYANDYVNS